MKTTNGADGQDILTGTAITWTYVITNTGNVAIDTNAGDTITVTDDQGVIPVFDPVFDPGSDAGSDGVLGVGESWTYNAAGTAVTGPYSNVGQVDISFFDDLMNEGTDTATDASSYFGANPAVDIEKATNGVDADTPTGPMLLEGSTAVFTYIVTNPGNVPLANVSVTDDQPVTVTFVGGDADSNNLLDTNETWEYTASTIVTPGQYMNTGTVTADFTDSVGSTEPVTDNDVSHHFGEALRLFTLIIDEDAIDSDVSTIEAAAASHGVASDYLINDDNPVENGNPPLRWNQLFPGDVVKLPAGQVSDEGFYGLPANTPWSIQAFVDGTVSQSQLDKIDDVMPIRNQDLVQLVDQSFVGIVYDSDISMNYDPIQGNLQGARYGQFFFTVLAVEVAGSLPESGSDTSLYDIWVQVDAVRSTDGVERFEVDVRDDSPNSIEVDQASQQGNGTLTVFVTADDYNPSSSPGPSGPADDGKAFITVSVDGSDFGGDPNVDPSLLEVPMTYNASQDRYELSIVVNENVSGRRMSAQGDEGGAYNFVVTGPGFQGNSPPVAVNDSYNVAQDDVLDVPALGVLANDTDPNGDPLTAILVSLPLDGTVVLNGDGSFTYAPDPGFSGSDSFTYIAHDGGVGSNAATVNITVDPIQAPVKRFFVVDTSTDTTLTYDSDFALVTDFDLVSGNSAPCGAVSTATGSTLWVIDLDTSVYVYDGVGTPQTSWLAGGLSRPEGIASDETDIWIVDRDLDRVFYYANAAGATGNQSPNSSFALASGNRQPRGITTDGTHLWIVNSKRSVDEVFKYTVGGTLAGSWTIDAGNSRPRGITIDPSNPGHLWIVDSGTDRVYQYDNATSRISGSQAADAVFNLAPGNTNPQGIADPPEPGETETSTALEKVDSRAVFRGLPLRPEVNRIVHGYSAPSADRPLARLAMTSRPVDNGVLAPPPASAVDRAMLDYGETLDPADERDEPADDDSRDETADDLWDRVFASGFAD